MKFSRVWAMPSSNTFTIKPIGDFVRKSLTGVSVDPFARDCKLATYTNDLNPNTQAEYHLKAQDFLQMLVDKGIMVDTIIFDPPYSPRQISECYAEAGLKAGMTDTQDARMVRECRILFNQLARSGATCLSFGWNTNGMGKGWLIAEIMLVAHGGKHNDTICMMERKMQETLEL